MCGRTTSELYSGCQNAEGCLGKSEKDFYRKHHNQELQLREELSNLRQHDLSVADYTSKIKDICDSLASIDVNIEEGELVQICLGGLASKFGAFRIVVCTRENTSSFFDLQSMLLVEENHAGALTSMHVDNKMLYTEGDRPHGHGGRSESVCNGRPTGSRKKALN